MNGVSALLFRIFALFVSRLRHDEGHGSSNAVAIDGVTVYRQTATFPGGTWPILDGTNVPWGAWIGRRMNIYQVYRI